MLRILKEEYCLLFDFLKEKRRFWLAMAVLSIGIPILAGVLLHFTFVSNQEASALVAQKTAELFSSKEVLFDDAGELSAWGLFQNNILATFLTAGFGIVPFLFLSGLFLTSNLLLIGAVCAVVTSSKTYSLAAVLSLIVPHGIFELPALCLGAGCGLLLCGALSGAVFHPQGALLRILNAFCGTLRTMVLLITPLLAVAAAAETYLTPFIFSLLV